MPFPLKHYYFQLFFNPSSLNPSAAKLKPRNPIDYRSRNKPIAIDIAHAFGAPVLKRLELLITTASKGLPPPRMISDVGSGGPTDDGALLVGAGAGGCDCIKETVGLGGSEFDDAVDEVIDVRVLLDNVVAVRETVLGVVGCVCVWAVEVCLLDVVVSAEGHNRSTRVPANAWPSTDEPGALTPSHTELTVACVLARPAAHAAEQALSR